VTRGGFHGRYLKRDLATGNGTVVPSGVLEEVFRGLLFAALRRAERLSESFFDSLLAWRHSGFSVHGEQRLEASEGDRLERLARYVTRPALATGAVKLRVDGRVEVATPPDPRTGADALVLDALDFVHAVVTQVPDGRKHLVRYYGAYSHRFRGRRCAAQTSAPEVEALGGSVAPTSSPPGPATLTVGASAGGPERAEGDSKGAPALPGSPEARRRSAWARLLKRVFEVDPLLCPRCKTEMLVVAWITDAAVIDRILAHRRQVGLESPFDARGPPAPA
jgi:hypothetical protein